MPNHVTNQLTFGYGEQSKAEFHKMLEFVKAEDGVYGSIDFNKLLTIPSSLSIEAGSRGNKGLEIVKAFLHEGVNVSPDTFCDPPHNEWVAALCDQYRDAVRRDPEMLTLGWQYYRNLRDHGAATWYEWSIRNWGTKWNAYDCTPLDRNADTMEFYTAWSGVPDLVKLLSERYPSAELTYRWADEDLGMNVGEITLQGGEIIDQDIPIDGSREAYEMAAEIRGLDLSECSLFLSKDGSTYEYRGEEPSSAPPAKAERASKPKKKKTRDAR